MGSGLIWFGFALWFVCMILLGSAAVKLLRHLKALQQVTLADNVIHSTNLPNITAVMLALSFSLLLVGTGNLILPSQPLPVVLTFGLAGAAVVALLCMRRLKREFDQPFGEVDEKPQWPVNRI